MTGPRALVCLALILALDAAVARARAAGPDDAAALPAGQLVERVACRQFPGRSYALYLPSRYTPEASWPVLFVFDPRQRGALAAELFRDAAEQLGVIVASSNDSRSDGPAEPNLAAMRAIWEDVHVRFRVDRHRVYASGFSGGARTAVMLATARLGEVAGVIAVGAGFPPGWAPSATTPFALYGLAAEGDFNYYELRKLDRAYQELGLPHTFASFPGTHDWAPAELCGDALHWLESLARKRGDAPKNEALVAARRQAGVARAEALAAAGDPVSAVRRFEALLAELAGELPLDGEKARADEIRASAAHRKEAERDRDGEAEFDDFVARSTREVAAALRTSAAEWTAAETAQRLGVPHLRRTAAKSPSPATRRTARQSLEALFVQTWFYLPEARSAAGDYAGAARLLEIAAQVHPEYPWLWYRLAQASALAGEERAAIKALRAAFANGFTDRAQLESDPAFELLRRERAFRELAASLDAPAQG